MEKVYNILPEAVEVNGVSYKKKKMNDAYKRTHQAIQWSNALKEQDAGMKSYK